MNDEDRELYEKLAAIEHERWSGWQTYVHDICGVPQPDGSILLPAGIVAEWERKIDTAYNDLTEVEKNSDREQVDHYWHLIRERRA